MTDFDVAIDGDDPVINATSIDGDTLYFGGDFDTVDGEPRDRLAAVDAHDGGLRDWDPAPEDTVYGLGNYDGQLYVGGRFSGDDTTIGGASHDHVARLDGDTGGADDWTVDAPPRIATFAFDSRAVYLGVDWAYGGSWTLEDIGAADPNTGEPLLWNPDIIPHVRPRYFYSATTAGDVLFVGGPDHPTLPLDEGDLRRRFLGLPLVQ